MTIVGFSDYLSHAHFADRWRFVKDLDSLAGIMKESDAAVHLALHCHSFLCSNSLMFGCPINASRRFISPALPRKATIGQNVIVLMGSTGSGKTCFMHTIAGLLFQAGFFVNSRTLPSELSDVRPGADSQIQWSFQGWLGALVC